MNYVNLLKSYVTHWQDARTNFENNLKNEIMPLLTILIVLIVAGVLLWLVNNYIPMDSKIKSILNIVVVIVVIGWLLKIFGVFDYLKDIQL